MSEVLKCRPSILIRAAVLRILLESSAACWVNFRSDCIQVPRNLIDVLGIINWPLRRTLLGVKPKPIISLFFTLRVSPARSNQHASSLATICSLELHSSTVFAATRFCPSSAKRKASENLDQKDDVRVPILYRSGENFLP